MPGEQIEQMRQRVRLRKFDLMVHEHSLDGLLGRLLRVEAEILEENVRQRAVRPRQREIAARAAQPLVRPRRIAQIRRHRSHGRRAWPDE